MEELFSTVRAALPADISVETATAPYQSRGLARRIGNVAWASRFRGRVAHVTGDILYVTPVLGDRSVITVHDVGWLRRGVIGQRLFELLWLSIPARTATAVTTVSTFTRNELMRLTACPESKIRVIPNCVDPAFGPAPARERNDVPVVLAVGTTNNKNLERLCAALEGMSCTLHVIGPLAPAQWAAVRRHGIVCTNSIDLTREQLVESYRSADVVAFASCYEGFGLPIIEGQAVGRPVLTSRVASMPEVAGDGALLVDPFDVRSIREGLLRILSSADLRSELRERGFANVRRFQAGAVAAQYAQLYRELAAH